MQSIANIRKDYKLQTLLESDVSNNPIDQFAKWWDEAVKSEIEEINAMTLATADKDGKPAARIVLLKSYDKDGFTFFSNYNSHKGKQMEENPKAALVIFWKELERQIRIEGVAEKLSVAISDEYFYSRPEGSRIGAWASPQSKIIAGREVLEKNVIDFTKEFAGNTIPRPQHWGGYLVKPNLVEFWQGRPSRLHDRIQYSLLPDGGWKIDRLAP